MSLLSTQQHENEEKNKNDKEKKKKKRVPCPTVSGHIKELLLSKQLPHHQP
jgi:hypothetical protein